MSMEPIVTKTYTDFWKIQRTLYSINDIVLPIPIPLMMLGIFVATGIPVWAFLMFVLHIAPFANFGTVLLWFGLPAGMAWLGNRPIFEGKSLFIYLLSRIKFVFEAPRYAGMRASYETLDEQYEIDSVVYLRDDDE